jgi:hypothetical protein
MLSRFINNIFYGRHYPKSGITRPNSSSSGTQTEENLSTNITEEKQKNLGATESAVKKITPPITTTSDNERGKPESDIDPRDELTPG